MSGATMTAANNEAQSGPPTSVSRSSLNQLGSGSAILMRLSASATTIIAPSSVRTTGGQKARRTGRTGNNSRNGTPAFSRMYSMTAQQKMMVNPARVAGWLSSPAMSSALRSAASAGPLSTTRVAQTNRGMTKRLPTASCTTVIKTVSQIASASRGYGGRGAAPVCAGVGVVSTVIVPSAARRF